MLKAEIKRISEFLKDLEEGLYEWDYTGLTAQHKLDELYPLIKTLMYDTLKTKDKRALEPTNWRGRRPRQAAR